MAAYFYPRSPCGERLKDAIDGRNSDIISIHALLAESDAQTAKNTSIAGHFYPRSPCGERRHWQVGQKRFLQFLSTLSLRRATLIIMMYDTSSLIFLSTLSLRRATVSGGALSSFFGNFYPRSPCGERQGEERANQSEHCISIHALLAESDVKLLLQLMRVPSFLSTLSLRRATVASIGVLVRIVNFYPRSPCGERPESV